MIYTDKIITFYNYFKHDNIFFCNLFLGYANINSYRINSRTYVYPNENFVTKNSRFSCKNIKFDDNIVSLKSL